MTNKDDILRRIDFTSYYQSHIPSLKVNGKPEALGLCPFHDDHNSSLSVNLEKGLYHCFSCGASGDVFTFYQKVKGVGFSTALKELEALTGMASDSVKSKERRVVAEFKYEDVDGKVLYTKTRIEPGKDGRSKEFVFKHRENGKWIFNRGCDPVLYRLPEIAKSQYCFVVEGEGKADLLAGWGLVATCLDSGANSPVRGEYIEILSRLEKVAILPDNDTPGKAYANKIVNALHGKVKELRIIELPGLGEAEDIIDWAKVSGNTKERLIELVKDTPLVTEVTEVTVSSEENNFSSNMGLVTEVTEVTVDSEENNFSYEDDDIDSRLFPPELFPFDVFPERLLSFIDNVADSLHVERELIACSIFPILSSVIGNSVHVRVKQDYKVALFCWLIILADSGYGKSPAINKLMRPLENLQGGYWQDYQERMEIYEIRLRELKKSKASDFFEYPQEPILKQSYIQDTTVEALADTFIGNGRGIILHLDEMAALMLGFGQYKQSGSGNDREHYLSMFNAGSLKINRKTGVRFIPNTGLSILGGIQPAVMPSIFSTECFHNGLLPRFLLLNVENKPDEFSMNEVSHEVTAYWENLINMCSGIPLEVNDKGFIVPKTLTLSKGAIESYRRHYNKLKKDGNFLSDKGKPFIPKLVSYYTIKFAGILHILSSVPSEPCLNLSFEDVISQKTMNDAINLTQFFVGQAMKTLKLYGMQERKFTEHEIRLVETLHKLQDKVSGGELQLKEVVASFNDSLPEKLQYSSKGVGNLLNKLGLTTRQGGKGFYYLVWEEEKIEKIFSLKQCQLSQPSQPINQRQVDEVDLVDLLPEKKIISTPTPDLFEGVI